MIKVVIMDLDGVLTDGKVTIDSSGNEFKTIDYRDIDAIFEMKRRNIKVGMITGESTPITLALKERFKPDFFYDGCKDKTLVLKEICAQAAVSAEEICYVGDGKYDIAIMKMVRFAACPANAISEVKAASNIHLKCSGGNGCIAELLKLIEEQNNHGS
jgi:YrbI family 3-deoxy-D-manno-octulosonate 8-phosphate phosphatase